MPTFRQTIRQVVEILLDSLVRGMDRNRIRARQTSNRIDTLSISGLDALSISDSCPCIDIPGTSSGFRRWIDGSQGDEIGNNPPPSENSHMGVSCNMKINPGLDHISHLMTTFIKER